jgi:CHAT domain-containing protein
MSARLTFPPPVLVLAGLLACSPCSAQTPALDPVLDAQFRRVHELLLERRPDEALPVAVQAVADAERILGADDPYFAAALFNLGAVYECLGRTAEVPPLYERALQIAEKAQDPEVLAGGLLRSGRVAFEAAQVSGEYENARAMLRRALEIGQAALAPDDPRLFWLMEALASAEFELGDYPRGIELFTAIIEGRKRLLGPEDPDVAASLNYLGTIYFSLGDYGSAQEAFEEALPIAQRDSANDPVLFATVLDNLGGIQARLHDYARAAESSERALAIYRVSSATPPRDVVFALNNLAVYMEELGLPERADSLLLESLAVQRREVGPDHREIATPLLNLARLHRGRGDYAAALRYAEDALAVLERSLGPEHPRVADVLATITGIHAYARQIPSALAAASRGIEIEERSLALILGTGSEPQKRLYMETLTAASDHVTTHLEFAPEDPGAAHLALTTLLRRRGRVLDVMRAQVGAFRRDAEPRDRALLDRWNELRSGMAGLIYAGPEDPASATAWRAALDSLGTELARTEASLATRSRALIQRYSSVTLDQVASALPDGSVLVEFAVFRTALRRTASGEFSDRYAAYLLDRAGTIRFADLGDAVAIDSVLDRLNAALQDPDRSDVMALARTADELVMRPVRTLAGPTRHLILSPDANLNAVPFAALVDEEGRFLVESYTITYVTSGRDILSLTSPPAGTTPPLVMGDPRYDGPGARLAAAREAAARSGSPHESEPNDLRWERLPGTAGEARVVAELLPGARLRVDSAATEAELKSVSSPRILHLATHGFFLPSAAETADAGPEIALLQAGIALSGANLRQDSMGNDGIVTAFEAAGLDLWDTELVVLSACQTGVGTIRTGEGVYGLRRALVIAGARSQLMSLWRVEDIATRDLMVEYYGRLLRGESRANALREVQTGMLNTPDRSHPYYWAAFVPIGDWRPLALPPAGARDRTQ